MAFMLGVTKGNEFVYAGKLEKGFAEDDKRGLLTRWRRNGPANSR
jgi:ATP-dependent DNA ligase